MRLVEVMSYAELQLLRQTDPVAAEYIDQRIRMVEAQVEAYRRTHKWFFVPARRDGGLRLIDHR